MTKTRARILLLACVTALVGAHALGCGVEASEEEAATTDEALFAEPTNIVPRQVSPTSIVYTAEAVIDADVAVVWRLLSDLPGYAAWNPWVLEAEGDLVPGGKVGVQVLLGPVKQHADHVVMTVDPEKTLCWRDAGWNSRFVYAQRCRWLAVRPDGKVQFRQQLFLDRNVDGLNLAGAAKLFTGAALQAGMDAETAALVRTAEATRARP